MQNSDYRQERSIRKYLMEGLYHINGWQPFLHHLKAYYKVNDKFRPLVEDGNDNCLSLKNYYVNLALVTESRHEEVARQLKESSLKREERYQTLLLSGNTLGVNELYDNLDSRSETAGWISITGRAGAGKTTLLQYIAYRWGGVREGMWHNRFDFVFRVQLNLIKNEKYKQYSYEQILSKIIYESFSKAEEYGEVLSENNIYECIVDKNFRNRTLLLLDGFDEIQGLYNDEHKHVKDFIDRVMRQFPNGVMATRPDALPKSWQTERTPRFKKHYENVGFTVENVHQYVDKYFSEEEVAHKDSLRASLDAHPEMMSLAQIPINAYILCLTWKDQEKKISSNDNKTSHFTMTQLYNKLLTWLVKRYCNNFKSNPEKDDSTLLKICEKEISTLAEIAYTAFVDKKVQFLEGDFVKKQVKSSIFMNELSKQFGILRAFNKRDDGYADYYYFVHLTYQEFFAALYIAEQLITTSHSVREKEIERRQKIQEIAKIIEANRDKPQYEVIWIFLAGLVSTDKYQAGADYFWDAIIEFPKEGVQAVTFHPHLNILKSKQRLCREAFLTLQHNDSISIPQRLSKLRTHFQHLHLWQGVQQTKELVQTWAEEDNHSGAAKAYQNTQQQYQTDALALGYRSKLAFSLPTFITTLPKYRQYVVDLLAKCQDESPMVRSATARALGEFGAQDPAIIQSLRNLLKGPADEDVCFDAIYALGELRVKDSAIIQDLRNLLQDKNWKVRSAAACALGELGAKDSAIIKDLRNLLKTESRDVRLVAADALGKLGVTSPAIIQDLQNLLKDDEWCYRHAAASALGELGVKDSAIIQDLRNLLKDKVGEVRIAAADALGELRVKDSAIIQDLRNLLKNEIWRVRRAAACALGELGVTDSAIIQDLRNLLKGKESIHVTAARALVQLGVKDPVIIQDLRNLLRDGHWDVRLVAACALGELAVADPAIIQDLQNLLKDSMERVRSIGIQALKCLNALTMDMCVESLKHKITTAAIRVEIYMALLRIKPEEYVPFLATDSHPDLVCLFISTVYFQGAMLLQKEGQLFLNETFLTADPDMIQSLYSATAWFADVMHEHSESLQSMRLPIEGPSITHVLNEDFLTIDLPVDEVSALQQWKAMVESSFSILSHRVVSVEQDITLIKEELNRIRQTMEVDWENVKVTLSSEDSAYINEFKQQLVQMYIVATVASSGEVQMKLTGTTGTMVTVLDVIAGLVPWGGGAVQMLSYLTQAIGESVKQNRMSRVLQLGSTPEEVAQIATALGQRLLHCLEIEHFVRDGRINRLFNSLGNIVGSCAETGFYGALFAAFTESGTVEGLANQIVAVLTPSEIEERASQDAQLLLAAVMAEGVPHSPAGQIDIDRLFLYSAPLLTVIDRMFAKMVEQYCAKHHYDLTNISQVKRKTQFCTELAKECHKRASPTAERIEDSSKRNDFIENVATECNRRNLLLLSKNSASWGIFRQKSLSTTLSIDKAILKSESKVIEEVYHCVLK